MFADSPSPLAFRHQVHRLSDPDQFGVALSGARLTADFLSPQTKPTVVEQFQTQGWALDFQEAHVKARLFAPLPDGWAALGVMRGPAVSSWYGTAVGQGVMVCNPPGEPIDGCITPGFSCMSVNVPVAVWERCRALAGRESDFGKFTALQLPPSLQVETELRLRATRQLLQTAATPDEAARAADQAAEFAEFLVTRAWEISPNAPSPQQSFRNRARLARQAETWMRDHLADTVKVPDVCLALGVSRRELEYAFRTMFDQSPRDFLQSLRLNAIRSALHRADAPVIEVAFGHGVTHLGRFAANYRSLFGESPSETRRRKWIAPLRAGRLRLRS